jgi:hypothetical protein
MGDHAVKAAEVATDPALVKRFPEFCGMEVHGDIITKKKWFVRRGTSKADDKKKHFKLFCF